LRYFQETAKLCNFQSEIEKVILDLIDEVPKAIVQVSIELPSTFPDAVATPVLEGLQNGLKAIQDSADFASLNTSR
jgi:hypothetical protein